MKFKYHMQVPMGKDATGQDIYQWAVGETDEQFFASIGRLYVEREGYKPSEKTLTPEPTIPTFREYSVKWWGLFVSMKPKNSQNVYRSELKHWLNAFGEKPITAITPTDVQQTLVQLKNKKKKYQTNVLNILRQILDVAVEDGYINRNVAKSKFVSLTGKASEERRILTDEELAHCIACLPRMENRDDKLFTAILIYTGMRPGEALGLEWEDIDFKKGVIHIHQAVASHGQEGVIGSTKTQNGQRENTLAPQLDDILRPYRGIGPIFTQNGKPYGQHDREQMTARIEKVMGIGHIIPYTFRHAFGTKAYECGVKLKSLSKWMGHADESITMKHYVHSTDKMLSETGGIVCREYERIAANSKK